MSISFDGIIENIIEKSKVIIHTISPYRKPLPANYEGETGIKNCKRIVHLAKKWPNVVIPDEVFEYHELIKNYFYIENPNAFEDNPDFYKKTRDKIIELLK